MANLLYLFGWNLLIATVMALAVWLTCRTPLLRRRPAVCHGLWLLVLLKLVTPPISPMSAWTAFSNSESAAVCPCGESKCTCSSIVAAESQLNAAQESYLPTSTSLHPLKTLLGISLLGTSVLWIVAARRFLHVRRMLKIGAVKLGRPKELLKQVSRQFNLSTSVNLKIVDAPISPMLWVAPGNRLIILPRQLTDSLDENGLRNIFAHELAHFVRRDHWVSRIAWIAATLWWWNPLVWIARRQLSVAAETACDALALDQLHGSRKFYAQTLLSVIDSMTATPQRTGFGIAFAESKSLRRRFEMIADTNVKGSTSRRGWIVLAVGVLALLIAPVKARENSVSEATSTAPLPAASLKDSPNEVRLIKFSTACCPT